MLRETQRADFRFQSEDQRLSCSLYQLEETDYSFLQRIASNLGAAVFPEAATNSPYLSIGLPKGENRDAGMQECVREKSQYDKETKKILL